MSQGGSPQHGKEPLPVKHLTEECLDYIKTSKKGVKKTGYLGINWAMDLNREFSREEMEVSQI